MGSPRNSWWVEKSRPNALCFLNTVGLPSWHLSETGIFLLVRTLSPLEPFCSLTHRNVASKPLPSGLTSLYHGLLTLQSNRRSLSDHFQSIPFQPVFFFSSYSAPRQISSPPNQQGRASVAICIRLVPSPNSIYNEEKAEPPASSLEEFFEQKWVNEEGVKAEILYIRRAKNKGDRYAQLPPFDRVVQMGWTDEILFETGMVHSDGRPRWLSQVEERYKLLLGMICWLKVDRMLICK